MSPVTGTSSGRLDRQIVIQTASMSTDPTTGQETLDWDEIAERPTAAEWLPETATETWKARQMDATIEGLYHTYWFSPLPAPDTTRILGHDGRVYDVRGVTEIGRRRGLMIGVAARGESV